MPYFLLKFEGFPDAIACQAFKNCERILFEAKEIFPNSCRNKESTSSPLEMDSPMIVSWKGYYDKKREAKWREWLHEYVYIDFRDERSIVKRFQSIQYFCKEGLIPFVNGHKYAFNPNYDLANELANFLYHGKDGFNRQQHFYRSINARLKMNIDYDYYLTRGIPDEDWNLFWKDWQWMTDFYDENFRNRLCIPDFVYNRLNLESSRATEILSEELEEHEDSDDWAQQTEQASEAIGQGKDKNSLY